MVPRQTRMQLLTFSIAGEPYAIEARLVIEVLPLVPARPIPQVPDYVLGIFTYRGDLVPPDRPRPADRRRPPYPATEHQGDRGRVPPTAVGGYHRGGSPTGARG